MLGGYQILDLRSIDLTLGSSASNITDIYVLNQLRNLREHIQKDYSFTKPLNNQVKPVLIRYRDKKNGEKHEGAIFGSVQVKTNYYTFEISAILLGQTLNIEVVFEEKTDDDGEKYWDIKTAKVLLTSAQPIFEEITDKDGHKRFIEGDINFEEGINITKTYGKWALSGTHLLIVIAGTIANGDTVASNTICKIDLPQWIRDKIYPTVSTIIESKSLTMYGSDLSSQTTPIFLEKYTNPNQISIYMNGVTASADRTLRIAFDLLIDNE